MSPEFEITATIPAISFPRADEVTSKAVADFAAINCARASATGAGEYLLASTPVTTTISSIGKPLSCVARVGSNTTAVTLPRRAPNVASSPVDFAT